MDKEFADNVGLTYLYELYLFFRGPLLDDNLPPTVYPRLPISINDLILKLLPNSQ